MKQVILSLAMLLTVSTAYNQTSRRTTNTNSTTSRSATTNTDIQTSRRTTNTNPTRINSTSSVNSENTSKQNSNKKTAHSTSQTGDRNTRNSSNSTNTRNYEHNNNNNNTTNRNNVKHATYNSRSTTRHPEYVSSRVYTGSHHVNYVYHEKPKSKSYRSVNYVYRAPVHVDIVWTEEMHRHYAGFYPTYNHWDCHYGRRIEKTSAYRAEYYIGEVKSVYGKITDFYYSPETDEYFLYIGPYYPYQDFTIVIPGEIARRQSHRPGDYFMNQDVSVTGLITAFEGKPEIVVRNHTQVNLY